MSAYSNDLTDWPPAERALGELLFGCRDGLWRQIKAYRVDGYVDADLEIVVPEAFWPVLAGESLSQFYGVRLVAGAVEAPLVRMSPFAIRPGSDDGSPE